MTAQDSKDVDKNIVEEVKQDAPVESEVDKPIDNINDDYQVILDDRGMYGMNDGEFFVKINRIEVRQMMSGWNAIATIFPSIASMGLDFKNPSTWFLLFSTSFSKVPGHFYQFLLTVIDLQYQSITELDQKIEARKFADYVAKKLKIEELVDIINVIYGQEKGRFEELIKKVETLFGPLMKTLKKEFTEPIGGKTST